MPDLLQFLLIRRHRTSENLTLVHPSFCICFARRAIAFFSYACRTFMTCIFMQVLLSASQATLSANSCFYAADCFSHFVHSGIAT